MTIFFFFSSDFCQFQIDNFRFRKMSIWKCQFQIDKKNVKLRNRKKKAWSGRCLQGYQFQRHQRAPATRGPADVEEREVRLGSQRGIRLRMLQQSARYIINYTVVPKLNNRYWWFHGKTPPFTAVWEICSQFLLLAHKIMFWNILQNKILKTKTFKLTTNKFYF